MWKTSLINATINEYYGEDKPDLNDILYINNLKEPVSIFRTELRTFCEQNHLFTIKNSLF